MTRTRPELLPLSLAFLLALGLTVPMAGVSLAADSQADAPAAADAPGGTASVVEVRAQPNTTSYLAIPNDRVESDRYGEQSLDVAGTVAADVERLRGEYAAVAFELELANTTDHEARVDRIEAEIAHIETRTDDLEQRQQDAIDAFNAGEITASQLLRELATVDAAARQLEGRTDELRRAVQQLPTTNGLYTQVDNLPADLVPLYGGVRAEVRRAMEANETVRVHVVTSGDGVVLSTVADGQYVREAYLASERRPDDVDQFNGIGDAESRAAQLYPWISARTDFAGGGYGDTSVYYLSTSHPHGELETHLDGASNAVFREEQVKQLNSLPTQSQTAANGNLQLQVNRTHATGPLRVKLTNPNTGMPINASVRVNGQRVGQTGSNGELWTITPHEAVRINATTTDGAAIEHRFFAAE